jgi:hypothetical protein
MKMTIEKTEVTKQMLELFGRFRTCGLKHIVQDGEYKTNFHFRGGMNKRISIVSFCLNGKDLYDMEFGKIYRHEYRRVDSVRDLYVDQLVEVFEDRTGYVARMPVVIFE